MNHRHWVSIGALALAGAGLWGGCASGGEEQDNGATKPGGAGAGSASGSAGIGGGFINPSASTGVGGGCASSSVHAEKVKLDMYIMLDQSNSMNEKDLTGNSKWDSATAALTTFVGLPEASGMGVGIEFFPTPKGTPCPVGQCKTDADCGTCGPCEPGGYCAGKFNKDSCDPADYEKPTQEIVELPAGAPLIAKAIEDASPNGDTPTSAALQGAIDHATNWMKKTPGHVAIVAFATDGLPYGCDVNLNNIYAIAAAGYNGTPSVRTYVIGVGLNSDVLNNIAMHGGTSQAYFVDSDAMATQKLIDAFKDIQGSALGCVYTVPEPPQGEKPDYGSVNVQYSPGGGGMPVTIPKVKDKASCATDGETWYYDNEGAPTQIILCDTMCGKVSGDTAGQMDIVLGCTTVLK